MGRNNRLKLGSGQFELSRPLGFRLSIKVQVLDSALEQSHSSYPAPRLIQRITDHPIYKSLKSKATQAKKWNLRDPLVVCIGSSLSVSLLGLRGPQDVPIEATIWAALHDTSKWPMIRRYNILRDSSQKRYRVNGANRISAVLVVSIENEPAAAFVRKHDRRAVCNLYLNEEARYPLSQEQIVLVRNLNFNVIPYGPQWETWQPQGRRERERVDDRSEPGKTLTWRPLSDGSFELTIPTQDICRLLAGRIDAEKCQRWPENA